VNSPRFETDWLFCACSFETIYFIRLPWNWLGLADVRLGQLKKSDSINPPRISSHPDPRISSHPDPRMSSHLDPRICSHPDPRICTHPDQVLA
jgi:hypothetical protein